MSDFFSAMFGDGNDEEGMPSSQAFDTAFREADGMAKQYMEKLVNRSKEMLEEGEHPAIATLLIFVGALRVYGLAKTGMIKSEGRQGKHNPVVKLWGLLEAAFGKADNTDLMACIEAVKKWEEDNGL